MDDEKGSADFHLVIGDDFINNFTSVLNVDAFGKELEKNGSKLVGVKHFATAARKEHLHLFWYSQYKNRKLAEIRDELLKSKVITDPHKMYEYVKANNVEKINKGLKDGVETQKQPRDSPLNVARCMIARNYLDPVNYVNLGNRCKTSKSALHRIIYDMVNHQATGADIKVNDDCCLQFNEDATTIRLDSNANLVENKLCFEDIGEVGGASGGRRGDDRDLMDEESNPLNRIKNANKSKMLFGQTLVEFIKYKDASSLHDLDSKMDETERM